MEAEDKYEGHPAVDQSRASEVAPKGSASIEVTYLSGATLVQLTEDVGEQVSVFKKRITTEMEFEPFTEVELLRDGEALPHMATLAAAGLEPGQSYELTGVVQKHWILDEAKKGDGVVLLGDGVVRNTQVDGNPCAPGSCRIILGKQCLPQGRHLFRVRLVEGDYYYIGVAEEGVNLNTWLGADSGHGWSFYLRDDKRGSRLGPGYKNYASRLHVGDTVTFCFDTVAGTLEIAQNDEELKPAQTGLQGKEMFFALGMGPNGVTLKLEDAWRER